MRMAAAMCCLVLCWLGGGYVSAAPESVEVTAEKKLAREYPRLADVCHDCAELARAKGLFAWACSFDGHALRFDPDHKGAREALGFKKKRGKWAPDEKAEVQIENTVSGLRERELLAEVYAETAAARYEAATRLFALAKDDSLARDQRLLALDHALTLSPDHLDSLRAVRARLDGEGSLYHLRDDGVRTLREGWILHAEEGSAFEEETVYETRLRLKMAKVRTPNFIVHVDAGPEGGAIAANCARYAEASRTRLFELLAAEPEEQPVDDAKRLHYTVFQRRTPFAQFVEACAGLEDKERRKEVAERGYGTSTKNPAGAVWLSEQPGEGEPFKDAIAHDFAASWVARHTGWRLYWLNRGLGYFLSNQMAGTVAARFFTIRHSVVFVDEAVKVEALPGPGANAASWRFRTARRASAGQGWTLSEISHAAAGSWTEDHAAWAFALAEYLLAEHREHLSGFLEESREIALERYRSEQQAEATDELLARLLKSLDMEAKAFDDGFSSWVIENYLDLPEDG